MKIIAVVNLKGGAGKTTVAMNLAGVIAERRRHVVLLDCDPQQSATRWGKQAQATGSRQLDCFDLTRDIHPVDLSRQPAQRLQKALDDVVNSDVVIIDCPPELSNTAALSALKADVVVVPVVPSPLDVWAGEKAVELIRAARKERGGKLPRIALTPSRCSVGTTLARDISETLTALKAPVSPAISQRTVLPESVLTGQTISTYAPKSPAHAEFELLRDFIFRRI